jgi:Phage terminase, small subunit
MAYLTANRPIPTKGKGSKLSAKQRAFVDEYMLDLNASQAVLRAGYKTNNPNRIGVELCRHPLVAQELEKRQSERRDKLEIKAEYLLNKLVNIIEQDGVKTQDLLRAIELAGKSIALWKERQEVSGPDGEAIKYEQKIKEDVADFTSSIARLAERERKAGLASVPNTGTDG